MLELKPILLRTLIISFNYFPNTEVFKQKLILLFKIQMYDQNQGNFREQTNIQLRAYDET
jgi:hypothetical protein